MVMPPLWQQAAWQQLQGQPSVVLGQATWNECRQQLQLAHPDLVVDDDPMQSLVDIVMRAAIVALPVSIFLGLPFGSLWQHGLLHNSSSAVAPLLLLVYVAWRILRTKPRLPWKWWPLPPVLALVALQLWTLLVYSLVMLIVHQFATLPS